MTVIAWIALVATGLFAGAALYVALVEHPARLDAGADAALAQWRHSYKRAKRVQAALAVIGAAAALIDGIFDSGDRLSILAALLLAAVVPFTMLVIYPTNRKLEEPHRLASDPETLTLLQAWGRLHWVRVLLGLAAFLLLTI